MDAESAKVKLDAIKEKNGREIRVFETSGLSPSSADVSNSEETEDFYEFTTEDYYRTLGTKKEDKLLKTRKIRDAEKATRRSEIKKDTTPKTQIKDMSQDLYSVGFIPGAVVYFLYDLPKGDSTADTNSSFFLQEEIMSIKGLEFVSEKAEPVQYAVDAPKAIDPPPSSAVQEQKPEQKKLVKPKWLKL